MKTRLLPPKNVRDMTAKSCGNCIYRVKEPYTEGNPYGSDWMCKRVEYGDENPWGDNIQIETTVCDGHKRGS